MGTGDSARFLSPVKACWLRLHKKILMRQDVVLDWHRFPYPYSRNMPLGYCRLNKYPVISKTDIFNFSRERIRMME